MLYGQWVFHAVRAELAEAQEVGNEMLRRAEEQGEMAARVVGHRLLGTGYVLRGALDQSRAHFERGLALYDPQLHGDLAFLYAQDPRAAGLSGLSWALLALGYPEQARARSREALESARELAHLNTQAYALLYATVCSQLGRDRSATQETGDALATLADEQGFPHFVAATKVIHGWALAETDDAEAGLAQIREGLAAWKATGAGFCVPYFLGLQAQAHARAGQVEEGLDRLIEALTLADRLLVLARRQITGIYGPNQAHARRERENPWPRNCRWRSVNHPVSTLRRLALLLECRPAQAIAAGHKLSQSGRVDNSDTAMMKGRRYRRYASFGIVGRSHSDERCRAWG